MAIFQCISCHSWLNWHLYVAQPYPVMWRSANPSVRTWCNLNWHVQLFYQHRLQFMYNLWHKISPEPVVVNDMGSDWPDKCVIGFKPFKDGILLKDLLAWCTNAAPESKSPVLHSCIMRTLRRCLNPIGSAWCLNAALASYLSGLHSCIMTTKGVMYCAVLEGLIVHVLEIVVKWI